MLIKLLKMKKKKNKNVKEPDWLDPKNDRKTPYTEKELDILLMVYLII